jgi:hypothetical protein
MEEINHGFIMKSVFLTLSILTVSILTFAQTDIYKEEFEFSYLPKLHGAQFLYNGRAHAFTIDIVADSIQTTESPNFISVDNHIVQTSVVPLPETNLDLNNLTTAQQKEALEGYVNYELDYFTNEVKIKYGNLNREWRTIHSKLWLIWSFDVPMQKKELNLSQQVTHQIYASTICFNQVLDLNIPLMRGDSQEQSNELLVKLMATLQTTDRHQ